MEIESGNTRSYQAELLLEPAVGVSEDRLASKDADQ